MKTAIDFETEWQALQPAYTGEIQLLVRRLGEGAHETPEEIELCPERGILGDRWSVGPSPKLDAQVTLMNVAAARLIVGDQPLHLPGDNLLVDFDLDEAVLPTGSRVRLGEDAVVEVSALLHAGCGKFAERFGAEALKWVNSKALRTRHMRGVNCRVISGGVVRLGERALRVE